MQSSLAAESYCALPSHPIARSFSLLAFRLEAKALAVLLLAAGGVHACTWIIAMLFMDTNLLV